VNFPLWARVGIGIGLAGMLAYITTPFAIVAARRFAFYDRPAGYKGHAAPTPYLGGAAVMLAYAIALLVGAGDATRTLPLLGGVAILFVVGTIDDRRTVPPLLRVVVEFGLGMLLAGAGIGWDLGAGYAVDAVINGIWVVAVVNAFNLFDNMDGAASTMAVVVAAAACVLGLVSGNAWVAVGSAALCGACLGFLPHNLASPARIFLGDGGSMPVGFAVAALVASAAHSAEPSLLALFVGFMLVGIPAVDTCLVIVSRRRRGISILTGGQDHLTHRTRTRMGTAGRVVLVLGSTQALVSALVIAATRESSNTLVYFLLAFVVCAGTAIGAMEGAAASEQMVSLRVVERSAASRAVRRYAPLTALFVLGLAAGLSPLFEAYYNQRTWVPIGFGLAVLAAAGMIARPPRLGRAAILAVGGVAGFGLLSLLSGSWAAAAEQATIEANRWLSYAAFLLLLLVFLRRRRDGMPLILGAALGIAIVGAVVLVRMLGSNPLDLFLSGRLNEPLGYVNGEGCIFAMGCWIGLAAAERREPWVAGMGASFTVAMACLALLSQARGAAVATLVAGLVVIAFVPGLRRRVLALAVIAAGVASISAPLLKVYSAGTPSVVHSAAIATIVAAAVVGLVWGTLVAAAERASRSAARKHLLDRVATVAVVLLLGLPVLAGLVRLGSIDRTVSTQWHAFIHNSDQGGGETHLLSGGGIRSDYWRVAWDVFTAHPVAGVGAGNYGAEYFRFGRVAEPIQNPHSLELQVLSELGVVGALVFALIVAGVVLGALHMRRAARESLGARTAAVAAIGVVAAWFVDTSGDWMHLLPGVSAVALAAIAVLCRERADEIPAVATESGETYAVATERGERRRLLGVPVTLVGAGAVAFVLAFAGASLLRTELTDIYTDRAQAELGKSPGDALNDANRAITLDGSNLDAYYLKAAAYARFDRADEARATLLTAAQEDPKAFTTWTLMGDLEVRLRNFASAKTFYEHAHRLDPTDPSIAELAANPASALSSAPSS
jgi:UDP-GlcNAc:undecaprenyl-phosphate GlcNAc-1-phosphate transferase